MMLELFVFVFLTLSSASDPVEQCASKPNADYEPPDNGFVDQEVCEWLEDDPCWFDPSKVIFPKDKLPLGNTLRDAHPKQLRLDDFVRHHNQFLKAQARYGKHRALEFDFKPPIQFKRPNGGTTVSLEIKFPRDEPILCDLIHEVEAATKKMMEFSGQWEMPGKIRVAILPLDSKRYQLQTQGRAILTRDGVEFQVVLGRIARTLIPAFPNTRFISRGGVAFPYPRDVAQQYSEYSGRGISAKFYATLLHEYGHAVHQLNSPERYFEVAHGVPMGAPWEDGEQQLAKRHLSQYAGLKDNGGMLEFVAEYFAATMVGMPVTEESAAMYGKYEGPVLKDLTPSYKLQPNVWPWAPPPADDTQPFPRLHALNKAYRDLGEHVFDDESKFRKPFSWERSYRAFDRATSIKRAKKIIGELLEKVEYELHIMMKKSPLSYPTYWQLRDVRERAFAMNQKLDKALKTEPLPSLQDLRDVVEAESLKLALVLSKKKILKQAADEQWAQLKMSLFPENEMISITI